MVTRTSVRVRAQRPEHWARVHPDRLAVIHPDRRMTFREWVDRADRLADTLARMRLPGDTAAVAMVAHPDWFVVNLALAKLGWWHVAVPPALPPDEVRALMAETGSVALFTDQSHFPDQDPEGVPGLHVVCGPGLEQLIADGQPAGRYSRADAAMVLSTSGTTGARKRVRRASTGATDRSATQRLAEYHRDVSDATPTKLRNRTLLTVPMHHGTGPGFAIRALGMAGTVHVLRHFDPLAAIRLIDEQSITHWMATPPMLHRIRQLRADLVAGTDLSSVETLILAGDDVPAPLRRWVAETFGPGRLHNFYGATEVGIVASMSPGMDEVKPGASGQPHTHVEVRVVDASGAEVPPGVEGELLIRTPATRAVDAADTADADGFHRVGDIGSMDADGFLYLLGRTADVIERDGTRIHPANLERALAEHPSLTEVAVVSRSGPAGRDEIVAVCETGPEPVPAEQLTALVSALAPEIRPDRIVCVDSLPRNDVGKVLRQPLRHGPLPEGHRVDRTVATVGGPADPVATEGWLAPEALDRAFAQACQEAAGDVVPQPEQYRELARNWPRIRRALIRDVSAGTWRPGRARIVPVPKTRLVHRPVPVLDPVDRVVLVALVESIRPALLPALGDEVFGVPRDSGGAGPTGLGWLEFENSIRQEVRRAGAVTVVATDIASFAENIRPEILAADLARLDLPAGTVERLMTVLDAAGAGAVGLPHDQDATGLLSTFYLAPGDAVLRAAGVGFRRFQDDMVMWDASPERLRRALAAWERCLRARRLGLSAGKTLMSGPDEALARLVPRGLNPRELFDKFRFDPDANSRPLRFALARLGQAADGWAATWAIERLADAPHLGAALGGYLRALMPEDAVTARALAGMLAGPGRPAHPFAAMHGLRALERSTVATEAVEDLCWSLVSDRDADFALRQQAARWLGRHASPSDQYRLEELADPDDPWVSGAIRAEAHHLRVRASECVFADIDVP